MAANVGSSSVVGSGGGVQRRTVVSSSGTFVTFFQSGSQSPGGIAYSTSTDNGTTWSAPVQVDPSTTADFAVAIDGSDNIYLAFADSGIKTRKLTFSAGSWSIGSVTSINSNFTCVDGVNSGQTYWGTNIVVNGAGNILLSVYKNDQYGGGGCADDVFLEIYSSNNGTAWSGGGTGNAGTTTSTAIPMVADGKAMWSVISGELYVNLNEGAFWTKVTSGAALGSSTSLAYGLDELHMLYENTSNQIVYRKYSIASGTLSSETIISSVANDYAGQIVTDSHNIWAIYGSYVSTNSYNIVYKRFNGSSWDVSATSLTTDNLNNTSISTPSRIPNTINLPVVWSTGTANPYSVKSATVATTDTFTDTGNTSGTYSGTLTGNSGDVIVKCGTWYYNSVNIVAGMTVKVCASDGATGGNLTIYANTVTVAGTIDGAGRGSPGGVTISGFGGAGGNGGSAGGWAGSAGTIGTSSSGSGGVGNFGGTGGAAGTNGVGSSGGGGNVSGLAGGGQGGVGSTTTIGQSGTNGGYSASGANGDTSTDESLLTGSGGGAGGGGGSGGGGGGGGGGGACATGGSGGGGGAGGIGGKGGNGGALVKIYSNGGISVSGSILTTGQSGGAGGSGQTGTNGTDGQLNLGC